MSAHFCSEDSAEKTLSFAKIAKAVTVNETRSQSISLPAQGQRLREACRTRSIEMMGRTMSTNLFVLFAFSEKSRSAARVSLTRDEAGRNGRRRVALAFSSWPAFTIRTGSVHHRGRTEWRREINESRRLERSGGKQSVFEINAAKWKSG